MSLGNLFHEKPNDAMRADHIHWLYIINLIYKPDASPNAEAWDINNP